MNHIKAHNIGFLTEKWNVRKQNTRQLSEDITEYEDLLVALEQTPEYEDYYTALERWLKTKVRDPKEVQSIEALALKLQRKMLELMTYIPAGKEGVPDSSRGIMQDLRKRRDSNTNVNEEQDPSISSGNSSEGSSGTQIASSLTARLQQEFNLDYEPAAKFVYDFFKSLDEHTRENDWISLPTGSTFTKTSDYKR